jgi:hypothetical protein
MQRRRISWSLVLLGLVIPCAAVNPEGTGQPRPLTPPQHFQKLAHTYSIVAWDPDNGDLGVAVQSKFPNVGGIVPWARAGVGAVATQSLADTAYGERALELMAQGATAEEALRVVMRTDTSLQDRQVGMVDAHGNAVRVTVVFLGDYIDRGPRAGLHRRDSGTARSPRRRARLPSRQPRGLDAKSFDSQVRRRTRVCTGWRSRRRRSNANCASRPRSSRR